MIASSPENMPPAEPGVNRRLHSLDGLRGLAALVVLVCHAFLMKPELAMAYLGPASIEKGTVWWWAAFSPLHLFWAGTEAVYLFFVLSGFVLALPFVRRTDRGWLGYYPKRLLRLYVPVWGAFALSMMWLTAFPRNFPAGASGWLAAHPAELTGAQMRADLLLFPYPGFSNSALWSLRYEVAFSLLLPLYVMLGIKYPKLNLLKAVLLVAIPVYFSHTQPSFVYFLPMFGLGVLMAVEHQRLSRLGARISGHRLGRYLWALLAAAGLLLLNSYWTALALSTDPARLVPLVRTALVLMLTGICLLLFAAINCGERSWLSRGPARWLGSRSFSLYLVHEPIVVSTPLILGAGAGFGVRFAFAAAVSLAVAEALHRLIERPSQLAGRWVERRLQRRPGGGGPATGTPAGTASVPRVPSGV